MHIRFKPAVLLLTTLLLAGCSATTDAQTNAESDEPGFKPLFDGKTLDGWYTVGGKANYSIDNAEIVGKVGPGPNTFLRTEKTYTDFEFRCEFKWDDPSNSGIQYRSHQKPDKDGKETGRVFGYQFELDPSDRAWSGGLYEEGRRKWLYNLKGDDKADKRAAIKLDGWNQVVIRCQGRHIRTWLNGVAIVDYTDKADEALTEGFIALQVHSGDKGVMRWRNLRLKEIQNEQADKD